MGLFRYSPGRTGCTICGAKDKGDLESPGFPALGAVWCRPCLYIGGKISLDYNELETYRLLGYFKSSIQAFKDGGIRIERNVA